MDQIRKKSGFGCMRLPMKEEEVNTGEFCTMVDTFLKQGFNCFDTAHGYLKTKSETAIHECLTSRHPRDSFIMKDKLTSAFFNSEEEIRPLFENQLKACGTEYFDFYLMHAQSEAIFEKFKTFHTCQ